MLDIREKLKFCCNAFLKDRQETDAVNYVSVLNMINGIIRDVGMSNAVSADIIANSDEVCLRISICGDNYSIAAIRINNGKIIFKDILEDEFDMVNFLICNHHLIECCKLWNRYLLF